MLNTLHQGMLTSWEVGTVMLLFSFGIPSTEKVTMDFNKKSTSASEMLTTWRIDSSGWDQCYAQWTQQYSSVRTASWPRDEEFVRRWQLACEGNIAHVVVMPNVTIDKLDVFLNELVQKRSTWYQEHDVQPPCIAADIGKDKCACPLHKWQFFIMIQNYSSVFLWLDIWFSAI